MVLPFDQHSITFDDIIYSVDMPQVTQVINISAFVSSVKRIRKIFSINKGVWFGRKTKSNGKSFSLTVKYEDLKCKIDYTSILPSNHFRKRKEKKNKTKREREPPTVKEREAGHLNLRLTPQPLDRTQSPLSLPSSLNLTGFDEFFLFGFVSFVFIY